MAANALTTVASTVVATELHARVSFGHGRPGLAGRLKSAAAIALGWLVTSAAVGSPGRVPSRRRTRPAADGVPVGHRAPRQMAAISCCVWLSRPARPRTGGGVRLRAAYDAAA